MRSVLRNRTILCLLLLGWACRQTPEKHSGGPEQQVPALETETAPATYDLQEPAPVEEEALRKTAPKQSTPAQSSPGQSAPDVLPPLESLPDTAFVRLSDYSPDFSYDLRYATEDNFLETAVYNCPKCYTRARTARALIAANRELLERGLRIRFFDCYRPNSVQYKMWEILPNPQYVANPQKGSHHNRGGAVDITLETLDGKPLDMGTDFDFFGRRAYHDTRDLPGHILENRSLLKKTMEKYGFQSVRTEWWHYNLKAAFRYPVADFRWPCLP